MPRYNLKDARHVEKYVMFDFCKTLVKCSIFLAGSFHSVVNGKS